MNVSDIIINFLVEQKVSEVFLMTGGHVAFLLDRLYGRDDIGYVCVAHEQAASMAADGFSRIRPDSIGVSIATSGPGATNLLTGIGCSWFDSIPSIHITGQVNTYESKGDRKVRQVGFQEMDIVNMAKPITKWATTVDEPENILWYLQKALHVAKSGRPGPVLLDIPMNFQRQDVDFDTIPRFTPEEKDAGSISSSDISKCVEMIKNAKRPAILAGGGVRNADASDALRKLSETIGAPVCLSMNGIDAFPHDHPNYSGFIGVYGNRGGNLTLANCDLLIAVGSRLDSRQTGVNTDKFARFAKKVVVDIDAEELGSRFEPDLAINGDAGQFLSGLLEAVSEPDTRQNEWLDQAGKWREKYPPCPEQYSDTSTLNPYMFMEALSAQLGPEDSIVLDTGQNMVWGTQVLHPRENIRMWTAGGMSPMGYSFPAAMGARFAKNEGRSICIIGDGGMQINIQELETIKRHNLKLTVFVVNNSGLGLIRQFQDDYLDSRHVAATQVEGYTSPDFVAISKAYGIKALRISTPGELEAGIIESLKHDGPVLVDVQVDKTCNVIPKALMDHPMEDQFPYINKEELLSQMIVEPLDPDSYRIKDD